MLTVVATAVLAQGDFYSGSGQQPAQNVTGQYRYEQSGPTRTNPWALPQPLVGPPGANPPVFKPSQKNYGSPVPADPVGSGRKSGRAQSGRFVTPEFLESLKQQQKQYQVMPDRQQHQRHSPSYMPAQRLPVQPRPVQPLPVQPLVGLPGQGGVPYPLYGMGSSNPLYDAPMVSPWGDGADVLYRGESYPLVPDEAIGGIAPMPMPAFGIDNGEYDGSGESPLTDENNVFNPFTFLPNRSLRGQ